MYVIPAALQNGTAAFDAICLFFPFFFLSCSLVVGCPQLAIENDDDEED